MKFLTVRDLRGNSARVWKELPIEQEMVITSNGRPVAILSAVSSQNVEENLSAIRQARAMNAVSRLQREASERGVDRMPAGDISAEIDVVRRARAVAR